MGFARSFKRKMRTPSYMDRVIALGQQLEQGKVYIMNIKHGDTCGYWLSGRCSCHPDLEPVEMPRNQDNAHGRGPTARNVTRG